MTKKEDKKKIAHAKPSDARKERKETNLLELEISNQEELFSYLKRGEKLSQEILKSLKFIRKYYFWRSLFNGFKIAIVILVIIFGIVTWDNIAQFFTSYSTGDMERGFSKTIKDGLGDNFNF